MRGPTPSQPRVDRGASAEPAPLHYTVTGSGPAVLFVHGFPTHGGLWGPLVERLRSAHTCVVVDLPGFGASPALRGGRLDPQRFVAALEALRERLGLPNWHVVGHDAGAAVAVHYAGLYAARVNGLVLMAAPLFPDFAPPAPLRLVRTRILGDVLAPALVRALLGHLPRILHGNDGASTNRAIVRSFGAPFRGLRGARRFVRLARWGNPAHVLGRTAAALPALTMPTRVLHGAHDPAIPLRFAQRAAAAIPGATLHVHDCGHFLPLDAPDAIGRHVAALVATSGWPSPIDDASRMPLRRPYRTAPVSAATRARTAAPSAKVLSPHQRSAVS